MDIDRASKWIAGEWAVVTHAPIIFVASLLVIALFVWRVIQWQYKSQLTNVKSTLELRDAQLQDYKDKLSGATPDEARARMDALESRIDKIVPQLTALSPRRIETAQRQAMAPLLDRFRGSTIQIVSDATSVDGAQMSKGLAAAFNASSWIVHQGVALGLGNSPPSGIGIRVKDPRNLTEQQGVIVEAFRTAGLEFDLQVLTMATNPVPVTVAEILLTTRQEE